METGKTRADPFRGDPPAAESDPVAARAGGRALREPPERTGREILHPWNRRNRTRISRSRTRRVREALYRAPIDGPPIEHVSVIIVNWNAGAALRACLAALFGDESGDPPQVILVDNASTDGSLAGLTESYPTLEIIRNAQQPRLRARRESGLPDGAGAVRLPPEPRRDPRAFRRGPADRVHDIPPARGRRRPEAPRSRRDGTGLGSPGSLRLDGPVRTLGAADAPLPEQPREPARAARALGDGGRLPSRSTGSPAPASSRAGRPGKRSGSSTSGSSSSGRTRTGVSAFGGLAGASTTFRPRAAPTSSGSAAPAAGWARCGTST